MNLPLLKNALQLLALPITAQVHLDRCEVGRVERLIKLSRDGYRFARAELANHLTREQQEALARVDASLLCMNPEMNRLVWRELSYGTNC